MENHSSKYEPVWGYRISSEDEFVLFSEYSKESKSNSEEESESSRLRDFRINTFTMKSMQDTLKSSERKWDDLISITDVKWSSDKPIISSNTN